MLTNWSLSQLESLLSATDRSGDCQAINRISTDTRSLQDGDLFVALSGPNFNGNLFVQQAAQAGAVAAVVSELQPIDLPQLVVADTRIALGKLAQLHRQAFDHPVVAITGSSGKTTVKEMLATILELQAPVLATRGNLNNDIGVPLTLLTLESQHRFAVIELGASAKGEIAYTVELTQPDVAILNNAAGAHLEGFASLQGVVEAKGEIFDGLKTDGVAVVNLDDPHSGYWLDRLEGRKIRTFSLTSPLADIFASHLETEPSGCCRFVLNTHRGQVEIALQVMGLHMVANALAAASAADALAIDLELIKQGLERFGGVAGRLAVRAGRADAQIVDDSYNANPDSVKAAIRVLASLPGKRILALGNMAELGDEAEQLHRQVGAFAAEEGLDGLYASGELAGLAAETFAAQSGKAQHRYPDNMGLAAALLPELDEQTTVLVKGSRSAAMEQVVQQLIQPVAQ